MVCHELTRPRERVLALLRAYAAREQGSEQAAGVAAETIRFVEAYPNCGDRSLAIGHLTCSARVVDQEWKKVLLTHHRKLGKWLQLGGHADGDLDLAGVALREAREESGLRALEPLSPELFDLDVHLIPARGAEAEHWHYDLRFLFQARGREPLVLNAESRELRWVDLQRVAELTDEESVRRMVRKTSAWKRVGKEKTE